MKEKRKCLIAVVLILAALAVVTPAFGHLTCGSSDEAAEAWLEEWNQQEIILLKSAQSGRIKAVLYENEAGQLGINVFERRLLGLRLKHDGMELYDMKPGLHITGHWTAGGLRGSKCDVVISGDNRGGEVGSYIMWDAREIARDSLEADYILDVYVLDGISALPKGLQQRAPDGKVLG